MFYYPQSHEEFLKEPSAVYEVLKFLDYMINANRMDEPTAKPTNAILGDAPALEIDDFLISKRPEAIKIRRRSATGNLNQFTFMRQVKQTLDERSAAREERCQVANYFRRLGNFWYNKGKFDQAITSYNYGLEYIKDTPVLYVNRALCYIKKRNYKRAIIDCDYVINNLSDQYMVAWLYRAGAYKRLNDEFNFNKSIYAARHLKSANDEAIDLFISKIHTEL